MATSNQIVSGEQRTNLVSQSLEKALGAIGPLPEPSDNQTSALKSLSMIALSGFAVLALVIRNKYQLVLNKNDGFKLTPPCTEEG